MVDERDETHVRLVDPHPERGRRDDDGRPALDECLLDARALAALEPCVVVLGSDPVAAERPRDLLARPPRTGVDDRRAAVDLAQPASRARNRSSAFSARSTS